MKYKKKLQKLQVRIANWEASKRTATGGDAKNVYLPDGNALNRRCHRRPGGIK